jgi:uncharacterized protein YdeI (BOF family)
MKTILRSCCALMLSAGLAASLAATAASAQSLTPIGELARGTMVTVQGTVQRISDHDEFRLQDSSGVVKVDLGSTWMPAELGEQVTVFGFVDDDLGPREIYARTLTRADGTLVTIQRYDD